MSICYKTIIMGVATMRSFNGTTLLVLLVTICLALPASILASGEKTGGLKIIYVAIDDQKLFAWEGNKLLYEFDVVTGRPGKETHPGVFKIFSKHADYTSKTYGSPMPYTMFFTKDGKALHGTQWATLRSYVHAYITESVGSHGCVGLTSENAKILFDWAPEQTRVVILEEEPDE